MSNYRSGLWGMLVGIVLFFVFWPIGLLLFVAGALAALTNFSRRHQS